jgi:hypothetical protein
MESQTRDAAVAALADAEASRTGLARGIVTPSWFFTSLAAAIAVQIATTAAGVAEGRPWVLVAGLVVFALVAGVQLARFRRRNGVWLGGFASRVVLGTGTRASLASVVALGAAIWAAYGEHPWLVALWSLAGGAVYALAGREWLRRYRAAPEAHSRGESLALLALLTVAALGGLALLVAGA